MAQWADGIALEGHAIAFGRRGRWWCFPQGFSDGGKAPSASPDSGCVEHSLSMLRVANAWDLAAPQGFEPR